MNEANTIQRAQQGDEEAWLILVRQHQQALFQLAYLLAGDADTAEDVVQDALLRAYHGLARFDSTRPLRPWLLQIVRNLARNHHRAANRYLAALQRWWQERARAPAYEPDPGATPTGPELLWQAIRQLDRPDQEVIYLRYFLELSVADTATALAIAEGTVKSRLARAIGRLRDVVQQEYPALDQEMTQ